MGECRQIQEQFSAYVDGEVPAADRSRIEAHVQRCPPCRSQLASERATHDLLTSRRDELRGCAPEGLHERCAAQRAAAAWRRTGLDRGLLVPLSLAATLVLAAGLLFIFGWGSSVDTYAAQLADDHTRCFKVAPEAAADASALGRSWQMAQGWPLKLAAGSEEEGLRLVAIRRCGSTRGDVAHVLYRWRGRPLSVYVLNASIDEVADASRDPRAHESIVKAGEHLVVWRNHGRTYAVVARGPGEDVEHVAEYIRTSLE